MLTASGSTSSQSAKRTLAPAPGVTPPPTDGSSYRFLSDVIIARGLVEPAAMKAALQASLAGRSLTEILVDNGELSEDDLARTLAEHHRLDHVDLDVFAVDPAATALVEPDIARRFGAVPIALLASGTVVVALYDPNGSTAVLEFAGLTDRVIQPAVASRTQIEALIDALRRPGRQPASPPAASVPQPQLRSVPAGDIVVPPAGNPPEFFRPAPHARAPVPPPDPAFEHRAADAAAPAPAATMRDTDHYDARFDDRNRGLYEPRHDDDHERAARAVQLEELRERAETAEHARHEADERARVAEERARDAEQRAREVEERARAGDEHARGVEDRARSAEDHARGAEERVRAAQEHARGAEERAHSAEERARVAEEHARAAEELTRLAEARAQASEERALAAGELVDAAEARADGMSSAADAANETLARLVRVSETLEREAQSRGPEMDVLRAALDAERSQRTQLETRLHAPQPTEELVALHARIAELERALAEQRASVPAPPPPVVHAPAPPVAYAAPRPADPAPAPVPEAFAVREAPPEPVARAYVTPSVSPTIDIPGEPGVPYVSALAPMPSNDAPARRPPKSTTAKARGLRRLISAIKRGA